MTQATLTQDEIKDLFDKLNLSTEQQRAERVFTSLAYFQQEEVSGEVHTHTYCSSDQ